MTQVDLFESFELHSDDPWNLVCSVEAVGSDLLCRIHGGDAHVGAVALAEWKSGRAQTNCLVADGHKEDKIAIHGAHRLCGASRRQVVCLCGIHFEGIAKDDISRISQSAFALTRKAARIVTDRRLKSGVAASTLLAEVELRADEIIPEVEKFLATPWENLIENHGGAAAESLSNNFGNRVAIFAPLYLSNACLNDCSYCGFRHSARFKRATLSAEESVGEAKFLASRGFRVLDLVTGEVPTDKFVDYVCGVTKRILAETEITGLNLNIGSLSSAQYERLSEAGASGYHLYQESYLPEVYFGVHESGQKRDMASRLTGLHRVVEAGFEKVGLGILLGLGSPVADLSRMVSHAEILREKFPDVKLGFSLPRIQEVDKDCSYEPAATISDAEFMKFMLFLRLRFPDAHLTLTTREGQEVRDALLPLGITKVSAEVSTSPGGYTHSVETETDQFSISDQRTLDEMQQTIHEAGLVPVLD
jgi:2-iminoacetate synthase